MLIAWVVWLFGTSFEFGDCIRKRKEYEAYQALHEKPLFIVKELVRAHLASVCTAHVVNIYQGAITALSGVAVALFTYTLWRTTDRLVHISNQQRTDLERSIKAAQVAANAAVKMADASIAQESPSLFLVLEQNDISYSKTTESIKTIFPKVGYRFKNFGRTPAIIRKYFIGINEAKLAESLAGSRATLRYLDNILAAGKPTAHLWLDTLRPFSSEDRLNILTGQTFIWIRGWITYDDVFGVERTRRFLLQYDPDIDRFVEHGGKAQNYQTSRPSE